MFRVNLGPLDALDSFIEKILAHETTKSYLRKLKLSRFIDFKNVGLGRLFCQNDKLAMQ